MKFPAVPMGILLLDLIGCAFFPPSGSLGGKALVLVGSRYDTQMDLRGTIMDGMEMAVLLKNQGYAVTFLVDNGTLPDYVEDPAPALVRTHINEYANNYFIPQFGSTFKAATKANLIQSLDSIRAEIKNNEPFFFFYAGHSGNVSLLGLEDVFSESLNEALGFPNFSFSDPNSYFTDEEFALEMTKFSDETPKILIFDSCRSGGFIGQDGTIPLLNLNDNIGSLPFIPKTWDGIFKSGDIKPSNGLVLSASPELRDSLGDGDGGDSDLNFNLFHGFFTYTLLEGVKSGKSDLNGDGWISATELYTYSRYTIGRWVTYRPRISGGPYDILLFKAP